MGTPGKQGEYPFLIPDNEEPVLFLEAGINCNDAVGIWIEFGHEIWNFPDFKYTRGVKHNRGIKKTGAQIKGSTATKK